MEKELTIKEEIKDEVCLLHFAGYITKTSGEDLLNWRKWQQGLGSATHWLLLDFSKVEYINSAGIAALIRLMRLLPGEQYRTRCYGLSYHYEKLFKMVGLTRYLQIYPSEWAAMEGMQADG